ncbi:preprotein translocase subunit SecG [Chloroflexota bacterium]
MSTYVAVAQIITAIILIFVILLQARGGGVGGIFGQMGGSSFRSRRGFEQTLLRFTILLVIVFLAISIIGVRVGD